MTKCDATGVAIGLLLLLGWFEGCREPGVGVRSVAVETIVVTPSKATIAVGSFSQFAATVLDGNGKPLTTPALTWTTSDAAVATVYQTGIAVGVAPGTVTITAAGDGKSGSAQLTIAPAPSPALVVSNPVIPSTTSLVARAAVRTTATGNVVFVAVQVGLAPTGVTATIRNRTTRLSLTTLVADGGFDPVSLNGNVGDTIDVTISNGSVVVYRSTVVVGEPRPPVVIRTQPPAKKTDVPLNEALVVVFSEPIAPATLTTASLQLLQNGAPVAGTVRLLDSTHVTAEFVPAAPLAPLTAYQLLAAPTIHDLSGDPLATPTVIDFTTGGTSAGAVWSVQVTPSGATIVQGGSVQLTAIAFDVGDSNRIYGRPVTWSANNPAATVSATGLVFGARLGVDTIVATVDGVSGDAFVTVLDTQVVSVVVSPDLLVVPVGATHQMQTVLRDGTGTAVNRAVSWSTNARTIATVSASGLVQGVAAGPATITATSERGSGFATVTVQNGPILNVADLWDWTAQPWVGGVTACADTGTVGLDQQDGVPFNGMDWSVGSCTEPSRTLSRAQVIGTALTFTLNGASACHFDGTLAGDPPTRFTGTETCDTDLGTVTRAIEARRHEPAGSVTINPAPGTIILGGSVRWSTAVRDTAGRPVFGRVPTWRSDNPAVAVVSDSGRVTGVAVGTATISATVDGRTGTKTVTVQSVAFTSISSGFVNCGVSTDSAAYCWGDQPYPVGGGLKLASFQVGLGQICGLVARGAAYCWSSPGDVPQLVPGGLTFSSVTAGWGHACGLTANGVAYCWGLNDSGQVGNGQTSYQASPVAVAGGLTFTSLSAGARHTCGIATGGAAYCWGANSFSQLGNVTYTTSLVPARVNAGGLLLRVIAAGPSHTCAISVQGQLYCWGSYWYGELGIGPSTGQPAPFVPVAGGPFASVSVGGTPADNQYTFGYTCTVTASGQGLCWGANSYGQLGDGTVTTREMPAAVAGGLAFTSISAGVNHSCGLTTGGIAYCWGAAGYNGDGTSNASAVPVRVLGHP